MDAVWPYFAAIIPTILVGTLFYFIIKAMIEGDRRERLAQSRFEAEQDRRAAAHPMASDTPGPDLPQTGPGDSDPSKSPDNSSPES